MERRTQENFLNAINDSVRFLKRVERTIEKELKGLDSLRDAVTLESTDEEDMLEEGEQELFRQKREGFEEWKNAGKPREMVPISSPEARKIDRLAKRREAYGKRKKP